MKYDQLLSKKKELNDIINNSNKYKINEKYFEGIKKGIFDSFELFNSTIEFYKKYKDNVKLLMNEQKKIWVEWVNYYNGQNGIDKKDYKNRYNKWLFDYIFSNLKINEKSEILGIF